MALKFAFIIFWLGNMHCMCCIKESDCSGFSLSALFIYFSSEELATGGVAQLFAGFLGAFRLVELQVASINFNQSFVKFIQYWSEF